MSAKFVQIMHVPNDTDCRTIWALDDNGDVWEFKQDDKDPTIWKRLYIEREPPVDAAHDAARQQAEIVGAESFRRYVLDYLHLLQNDPACLPPARAIVRGLMSEIECLEIDE